MNVMNIIFMKSILHTGTVYQKYKYIFNQDQ